MQIVFKNKNERSSDREIDLVGIVIYTRRISRCLKGKCTGKFRSGKFEI